MDTAGRLPVEAESGRAPLNLRWLGRGAHGLLDGAPERVLKSAVRAAQCGRRFLPAGVAVAVALGPSHSVRGLTEAGIAAGNSALEITALVKPGDMGAARAWCRSALGVPGNELVGTDQVRRSLDLRRHRRIGTWRTIRPAAAWRLGGFSDREWPTPQGIMAMARGWPGVSGAPRVACRFGPGRPGTPGTARPTLLASHARIAVRTLACLQWVPAASAEPPHTACMADAAAGGAHLERMAGLDGGTPISPGALGTVAAPGASDGTERFGSIFRSIAEPPGVMIHVNRRYEGIPGLPARACVAGGAGGGQLSSGDRGSLPGRSTRYRVIWLVCAECGTKVPCLFYDECDIPICVNQSHGPMEISR